MADGNDTFGGMLPAIVTRPPGPASRALAERLRGVESRNVTYVDDGWPVFWDEATGSNVRDADGNVYLDLTSAFGVSLLGHRPPEVVSAIAAQSALLLHGMGDIHPPTRKLELLERLARHAPWDDVRIVLSTTGSEAVETALKTARLASGRPGILAFEGGYHGLTLGSLAATSREHFRAAFGERLYAGVAFAPFPDPVRGADPSGQRSLDHVARLLREGAPNGDAIGCLVVEPVQARAGARVPPPGFMAALGALAREHGVLVVADEIFTGMGRCGALFASSLVGLRPDVICVGKALGGGLPLSACLAPRAVMDAWPASDGEAMHTSTFLGHPLACAAGLAALTVIERDDVPAAAERVGRALLEGLRGRLAGVGAVADVRGLGLLIGVELVEPDGMTPAVGAAARVAAAALAEGLILLPAAEAGNVVELTPPVVLTMEQVEYTVEVLGDLIGGVR